MSKLIDNPKTIGERIKSLRRSRNISRRELAEYVGIAEQTIHKYETGIITNIPSTRLQAIAEKLGTTPSALMGWRQGKPTTAKEPELTLSISLQLDSENDADILKLLDLNKPLPPQIKTLIREK